MPSEQELKNEMFKQREILERKEKEVAEIKKKIADLEKQLRMAPPKLAAPIPEWDSASSEEAAPESEDALLEAPVPEIETAPVSKPVKQPGSLRSGRGAILQKLPTSGTSQITARETQYECPNCGSHYNAEVEDKAKILYVVGAGTRIYAKKHRCMNCGNEWA